MRNASRGVHAAVAAIVLGTLAFVPPAQGQELKELNILLPNNNTTGLYPAFVARDLKLFEKAGLKINWLDSETTVPYVAFLSNGQADAVMLDAPQTFQAVNAKLPIRVVYEAMQNAPEVLAVRDDSPIKSVAEMKGKTIGLASDRDQVTAQVVLDTAGISIDEVRTVVVGDTGPVMAKALRDNEIDALAAAINDMTTIEANGIKTRDITPPEVKINPANTFSVWEPRMEELRPHLEKFFRAWAMATAAGKIDRDAVAKMAAKSVPEEWPTEELGQSLLSGALITDLPVTEKYGDVQYDVWQKVQAPYVKFEQIEGEVDPKTFLDGSFIAAANDFTEEDVKAAIAEWRAANP